MATNAPAQTTRPVVEHIGKPMLGEQRLPFSEAVRVGDLLILSGQLGIGSDGKLPQGIEAQSKQAMDNVGHVLKGAGAGLRRLDQMHGDARQHGRLAGVQ